VDRLTAAVPEHMRRAPWGAAPPRRPLLLLAAREPARGCQALQAADPCFKVVDVNELLVILLDGLRVLARGAARGRERGQGHGGVGAEMARQRQLQKPQHL
jgi:hypothetical protein